MKKQKVLLTEILDNYNLYLKRAMYINKLMVNYKKAEAFQWVEENVRNVNPWAHIVTHNLDANIKENSFYVTDGSVTTYYQFSECGIRDIVLLELPKLSNEEKLIC